MTWMEMAGDWLLSLPEPATLASLGGLVLLSSLLTYRQLRLIWRLRQSRRRFLDDLRSQLR